MLWLWPMANVEKREEKRKKNPLIINYRYTNELHTNNNKYKINLKGKADFLFVGWLSAVRIRSILYFFLHHNISLNDYGSLVDNAFQSMRRWSDEYSFNIWNANFIWVFSSFPIFIFHMKFAPTSRTFCWKVKKVNKKKRTSTIWNSEYCVFHNKIIIFKREASRHSIDRELNECIFKLHWFSDSFSRKECVCRYRVHTSLVSAVFCSTSFFQFND